MSGSLFAPRPVLVDIRAYPMQVRRTRSKIEADDLAHQISFGIAHQSEVFPTRDSAIDYGNHDRYSAIQHRRGPGNALLSAEPGAGQPPIIRPWGLDLGAPKAAAPAIGRAESA